MKTDKIGTIKIGTIKTHSSMFDPHSIPKNSQEVLNDFQSIIQSVRPLSARQLLTLPREIRDLSHDMTDTRGDRRVGYMNEKIFLSAYTRYFMWWNLIRLTRLFANMDFSHLNLNDDSVCLDMGSGPLTVVIALWLARPELRKLHLTWYCMDISQAALSLGEDLYLSVAARVPAPDSDAKSKSEAQKNESDESQNNTPSEGEQDDDDSEKETFPHWRIVRVKGEAGVSLKKKVSLITCANMFNEAYQNNDRPPDFIAKKYTELLFSYLESDKVCNSGILVIEPGVPKAARFISLLRDCFIRKNMEIISPCPHTGICPMDGRNIHRNTGTGCGKWCNFAFSTDNAPGKLLRLSTQAGIPKERAVLSFVFGVRNVVAEQTPESALKAAASTGKPDESLALRIASDEIRLPGNRIGFYACSELGLTLVVVKSKIEVHSGDLLKIKKPVNLSALQHDKKTGAVMLDI